MLLCSGVVLLNAAGNFEDPETDSEGGGSIQSDPPQIQGRLQLFYAAFIE